MTLDRMKLSAQTVRENIAILEEVQGPDDAGCYLQLEHENFVLECIEKQIPKKVVNKPCNESDYCYCSVCNGCLGNVEDSEILGQSFCHHCGQALDWSDTE